MQILRTPRGNRAKKSILSNAPFFYIRLAKIDAPTTVRRPATTMDRLLIAPSTSPISSALAVPSACAAEPMLTPLAMGSVMRKKPAHQNCDHVAENAGDDDHGDRQRHVAAELFGNAHADGRRDGLRQKRHVFLVCKMKELAHHKHAAKRRDDAGENTGEDGLPVALQKR